MAQTFRWLHLTDLHWGHSAQETEWATFEKKFYGDLEWFFKNGAPGFAIDAVFFTGDLVNKGRSEEFKSLNAKLEKLWRWFGENGSNPWFLPVPGNHDLVRPANKAPGMGFLRMWRNSPHHPQEFWDKEDHLDLHGLIEESFGEYRKWWAELPAQIRKPEIWRPGFFPCEFAATLEKGGLRIGVLGLNSAVCHLGDGTQPGHLQMNDKQMVIPCTTDYETWFDSHRACFLLSHHPPDWFSPTSQEAYKRVYQSARFVGHLFGHVHEHDEEHCQINGSQFGRRKITGMSWFGRESWTGQKAGVDRRYGHALGCLTIEGDKGNIRLWPRQMKKDGIGDWGVDKADGWSFHNTIRDEGTPESEIPLLPQTLLPLGWSNPAPPKGSSLGVEDPAPMEEPAGEEETADEEPPKTYEEVVLKALESHLQDPCFTDFLPFLKSELNLRGQVSARVVLRKGFRTVLNALPEVIQRWMQQPDFRQRQAANRTTLKAVEVLVGWLATTAIKPQWQPASHHEAYPDYRDLVLFLPVWNPLSIEMVLSRIREVPGPAKFKLEWRQQHPSIKAPVVPFPDSLETGSEVDDYVDEIKANLVILMAPEAFAEVYETLLDGTKRAKHFNKNMDKRLRGLLIYSEDQRHETTPFLLLNPHMGPVDVVPVDVVRKLRQDLQPDPKEKGKQLKIVCLCEGEDIWCDDLDEGIAMAQLNGFYKHVAEARRQLEG